MSIARVQSGSQAGLLPASGGDPPFFLILGSTPTPGNLLLAASAGDGSSGGAPSGFQRYNAPFGSFIDLWSRTVQPGDSALINFDYISGSRAIFAVVVEYSGVVENFQVSAAGSFGFDTQAVPIAPPAGGDVLLIGLTESFFNTPPPSSYPATTSWTIVEQGYDDVDALPPTQDGLLFAEKIVGPSTGSYTFDSASGTSGVFISSAVFTFGLPYLATPGPFVYLTYLQICAISTLPLTGLVMEQATDLGSETVYQLTRAYVPGSTRVRVNGLFVTGYTEDPVAGTVTFSVPLYPSDMVVVGYFATGPL